MPHDPGTLPHDHTTVQPQLPAITRLVRDGLGGFKAIRALRRADWTPLSFGGLGIWKQLVRCLGCGLNKPRIHDKNVRCQVALAHFEASPVGVSPLSGGD